MPPCASGSGGQSANAARADKFRRLRQSPADNITCGKGSGVLKNSFANGLREQRRVRMPYICSSPHVDMNAEALTINTIVILSSDNAADRP